MRNWLLPEHVEDILPVAALHIEKVRRRIIDLLQVHGYQQVMPPLLEYVESLLSGSGSDMDLHMFKVIDQLSGRMMGLRADMTPQAARIDAHLLNSEGVTRLCYANSVLRTVPSGITQTREPLQVGAELYGHSGLESDLEIQRLMLQCLSISGVNEIQLDLGHIAVFRGLTKRASIARELEEELFAVLQAKDISTLKELCSGLEKSTGEALLLLPELYGTREILSDAHRLLPDYPEIRMALAELTTVEEELTSSIDSIITFDLSDLRGYHYHTGIVFSAYATGCSNAIAQGGRYDEIGKAFGRARPATGFSMDLRELAKLAGFDDYPKGIRAPSQKDKELENMIERLRMEGQIVIRELPGQRNESSYCDRQLVLRNGEWLIEQIV